MKYVALWVLVAIVMAVVEGVTVQLVSVWFVLGTIPAMIVAAAHGPFWLQLLMFLITSIIVLVFGRPLIKERLTARKQPTNSDRLIGKVGIVTEEINNVKGTGRVEIGGLSWMARTLDDSVEVSPKSQVLILKIEGVKLIVASAVTNQPEGE